MAQTANYGFEKPSTDKNVDEEFYQLQETLDLLDSILAALQTAVNGKAAATHTHAISDIVNLAAELAAKMPASQTFKLDDLTDVDGADGAPNGYVLVKSALGWLPSSALAALGPHGHLISEITGLVDALAGKADKATVLAAGTGLTGGGDLSASRTISADIADEPTAILGANNTELMTPLRTQQFVVNYNKWTDISDDTFTSSTSWVKTDLGAFSLLNMRFDFAPVSSDGFATIQFSSDNGSNWIATNYISNWQTSFGTADEVLSPTTTNIPLFSTAAPIRNGTFGAHGRAEFSKFNVADYTNYELIAAGAITVGGSFTATSQRLGGSHNALTAMNAIRFVFTNAMKGRIILEGRP